MTTLDTGKTFDFPPVESATEDGLVAVGGAASPTQLVLAYGQGIFPWPSEGLPLLWFSPDPRWVIPLNGVHVPRSVEKDVRRSRFEIRVDSAFDEVIHRCAHVPREGQDGTWITRELSRGYRGLHRMGLAHSFEAWRDGALVGGLYGVSLGGAFFGESMFHLVPHASKAAFLALLDFASAKGFDFVDCQTHSEHTARFGAQPFPRTRFIQKLRKSLERPTLYGTWTLES